MPIHVCRPSQSSYPWSFCKADRLTFTPEAVGTSATRAKHREKRWLPELDSSLDLAFLTLFVTFLATAAAWMYGAAARGARRARKYPQAGIFPGKPGEAAQQAEQSVHRRLSGWTANPEEVAESAGAPSPPRPPLPTVEADVEALRPE